MRQTLENHRKLAVWVGLTAGMLCGSLILIAWSIKQKSEEQLRTDRSVCRAINRFDNVVIATLHRSEKNIPHLAYFRAHPAELRQQLAEIRRQIRAFAPTHCR